MKLPFQTPSHATHHPRRGTPQLGPKPAVRFQRPLKIPLLPLANYHRTHPAFILTNNSICSRTLSPKPDNIEYA